MQAFEKTLQQWMEHFHTLLVFSCPALGQSAADVESPLDTVKAAVCQNINLFISMNEEEFAPFLPQFAQAVWTQLVSVSLRPGQVSGCLTSCCCTLRTVHMADCNHQYGCSRSVRRHLLH